MKKKGSTRTAVKLLCLLMTVMMSVFAFSGIAMAADGPVEVSTWEMLKAELKNTKPESESAETPTVIKLTESILEVGEYLRVANRNITLDLNGKTLDFKDKGGILVQANGYDFDGASGHKEYSDSDSGTLTIIDTAEVKGKITSSTTTDNFVVKAQNSGELVIDGVEIDASGLDPKEGIAVYVLGPDEGKGNGTSCTIKGNANIHGTNFGVYVSRTDSNQSGSETVKLTVEDGTISGKCGVTADRKTECEIKGGKINASDEDPSNTAVNGIQIINGGKCTVTGGTITSTKTGIWIGYEGSTLDMQNGTVSGTAYGISGNGTPGQGGTKITITGGTIKAGDKGAGMYLPQSGEVTIEDAEISGGCGIVQRAGKLEITGGTVTATAEEDLVIGDAKEGDNPVKVNPSAVVVDSKTNGYGSGGTKADVTIEGGTFTAQDGQDTLSNLQKEDAGGTKDITVEGGHFSKDPKGFYTAEETTVLEDNNSNEVHIGQAAAEDALLNAEKGDAFTLKSGTLTAGSGDGEEKVPDGIQVTVEGSATATLNGQTYEASEDPITTCTHKNNAVTVWFEPSCADGGIEGLNYHCCRDCGYSWYEVTTGGHTKPEDPSEITKTELTCTQDEKETYTCTTCGESETVTIQKATGHTWGEPTQVGFACDGGKNIYVCSNPNCDGKYEGVDSNLINGATGSQDKSPEDDSQVAIKEAPLEKVDHDISGQSYESDEESHWKVCKVCGKEVEKTAHIKSAESKTPAECTKNGETDEITCTECERVLQEAGVIEAKGHEFITPEERTPENKGTKWDYAGDGSEPTCTEGKSIIYYCIHDNCDKVIDGVADNLINGATTTKNNKAVREAKDEIDYADHDMPTDDMITEAKKHTVDLKTHDVKDGITAFNNWLDEVKSSESDTLGLKPYVEAGCFELTKAPSTHEVGELTIKCRTCKGAATENTDKGTKTEPVTIEEAFADDATFADPANKEEYGVHDWQAAWKDGKEATCAEDGTKIYKCTVEGCDVLQKAYEDGKYTVDKNKEDVVEKNNAPDSPLHKWTLKFNNTNMNDVTVSHKWMECEICHKTKDDKYGAEAELQGHHFVEFKTAAPSCEDPGYTIYVCDNPKCGGYLAEPDPKLNPIGNGEGKDAAQDTSTFEISEDDKALVAEAPEKAYRIEYTEATGHSLGELGRSDPTCTSNARNIKKCVTCGKAFDQGDAYAEMEKQIADLEKLSPQSPLIAQLRNQLPKLKATGHDFTGEPETKEATCTENGSNTYTCTHANCEGYVMVDQDGNVTTDPDQMDAGKTEKLNDEATGEVVKPEGGKVAVKVDTIPATNHNFADPKPVDNYGEANRKHVLTCTKCGETEEVACDSATETAIDGTCAQKAKTKYTCPTCNGSYEKETGDIDASKHRKTWVVDFDVTCEYDGLGHTICPDCKKDETIEYTIIPAGHLFKDGECLDYGTVEAPAELDETGNFKKVAKDPTEIAGDDITGVTSTYVCQRDDCCGIRLNQDVDGTDPLGAYKFTTEDNKAAKVYTDEATGHKFEKAAADYTKEATCVEDGIQVWYCTNENCAGSTGEKDKADENGANGIYGTYNAEAGDLAGRAAKVEVTKATGVHTPDTENENGRNETIENTCLGTIKIVYCKVCREIADESHEGVPNPDGHAYDGKGYTAATEGEADAQHSYTCKYCKQTVKEACSFTDEVVKQPGDCDTDKLVTKTCDKCGYSYEENEGKQHTWEEQAKGTMIPATCEHAAIIGENPNLPFKVCSKCWALGENAREFRPKLEHDYSSEDWDVTPEGHAKKCVNGCDQPNPVRDSHTFVDGVCECGYHDPEYVKPEGSMTPSINTDSKELIFESTFAGVDDASKGEMGILYINKTSYNEQTAEALMKLATAGTDGTLTEFLAKNTDIKCLSTRTEGKDASTCHKVTLRFNVTGHESTKVYAIGFVTIRQDDGIYKVLMDEHVTAKCYNDLVTP